MMTICAPARTSRMELLTRTDSGNSHRRQIDGIFARGDHRLDEVRFIGPEPDMRARRGPW